MSIEKQRDLSVSNHAGDNNYPNSAIGVTNTIQEEEEVSRNETDEYMNSIPDPQGGPPTLNGDKKENRQNTIEEESEHGVNTTNEEDIIKRAGLDENNNTSPSGLGNNEQEACMVLTHESGLGNLGT